MVFLLLAAIVVAPFLLELWAVRLGRRAGVGGFVPALKYVLPALFLFSILAAVATGAVEILWSHGALSGATIIAAGVSTAMNCAAVFLLAAEVAALVVLSAISLRMNRGT